MTKPQIKLNEPIAKQIRLSRIVRGTALTA